MAETLTDIANAAILSLGEEPIENIVDDTTDSARVLRLRIYDVVKTVQSSFEWPELYRFADLVDSGTLALDGVTKRWNKPPNLLQIRGVLPQTTNGPVYSHGVPWRVEGQYIVTAEAAPVIEYTEYNSDNVAGWSPELVKRVWTELASEIAPLLTKSEKAVARADHSAMKSMITDNGRASKKKQSTLRRGRGQGWNTERRRRTDGWGGGNISREGL